MRGRLGYGNGFNDFYIRSFHIIKKGFRVYYDVVRKPTNPFLLRYEAVARGATPYQAFDPVFEFENEGQYTQGGAAYDRHPELGPSVAGAATSRRRAQEARQVP